MESNRSKWYNRNELWAMVERKPAKRPIDTVTVAEGVIGVALLDMVASGEVSVSVAREWGLNL